jgi:hypothetical protein
MATRSEKDQAINELVEEIKATSVLYLADTSPWTRGHQQSASRLQQGRYPDESGEEHPASEGHGACGRSDYSGMFPTLKGQTSPPVRRKGQRPCQTDQGLPQEGYEACVEERLDR